MKETKNWKHCELWWHKQSKYQVFCHYCLCACHLLSFYELKIPISSIRIEGKLEIIHYGLKYNQFLSSFSFFHKQLVFSSNFIMFFLINEMTKKKIKNKPYFKDKLFFIPKIVLILFLFLIPKICIPSHRQKKHNKNR